MAPRLATLLIAVAIVPAFAAAPSLKGWRDGPASILLTEDEYRRFGTLKTEDDRSAFVERFWRDLEVEPGTSTEAFREVFERRATEANARFHAPGLEGWRTDRGRVFLALGEPVRIEHESGGIELLDNEVWTYPTTGAPEPELKVVFHHCRDGAYRLDASCASVHDQTSVSYDWDRANYLRALRLQAQTVNPIRLQIMAGSILAPVPGGLPQARSAPVPARERDARTAASAPATLDDDRTSALDHAAYFFRAQDGSVLTLLALELREEARGAEGAASPMAAVSLEEVPLHGDARAVATARNVALDALPAPAVPEFFCGKAYLVAGRTYDARFAVTLPAQDEVVVRHATIGVPDLNAGFSVSSLVPAERFGPAGPDAGRFQIGSEEVVPKAGAIFRRSEMLKLYLQVYGAAIDPATSMPRVDVEYRFFRLVKRGSKHHGKPYSVRGAAGAAMGLALPIGDWPVGDYRVLVDLHDRVSGQRVTVERTFSVAEG